MRNRELMRSSYIYTYMLSIFIMHLWTNLFSSFLSHPHCPHSQNGSPMLVYTLHCTRYFHVISVFVSSKLFFFFVSRIYKDGGLHCILVKCEHSLPCPLSVFSFSLIIIRLSPSLFAGSYIYTPPTIPCFKN